MATTSEVASYVQISPTTLHPSSILLHLNPLFSRNPIVYILAPERAFGNQSEITFEFLVALTLVVVAYAMPIAEPGRSGYNKVDTRLQERDA
ncbi:hypothetical protein NMY22_g13540 [Coprinellus aureogranulatus]|nr:hypothetical protein NMY22_g13540 [Coprinellus aureogranulatus]